MGEFDLDLRLDDSTFGWESVFRPQSAAEPGMIREPGTVVAPPRLSDPGCVYPCDPTGDSSCSTNSGHTNCGTCVTCGPGATGSPCVC